MFIVHNTNIYEVEVIERSNDCTRYKVLSDSILVRIHCLTKFVIECDTIDEAKFQLINKKLS